jgi:hypothetical protein
VVLGLGVVLFFQSFAQRPMFGICGIFAAIYKVVDHRAFIVTPPPLLAVTMFFAGLICFLLGLLSELGIRTYHESQAKPTYLISSRDNVGGPARRSTDRVA